jgi:hypothetical protein
VIFLAGAVCLFGATPNGPLLRSSIAHAAHWRPAAFGLSVFRGQALPMPVRIGASRREKVPKKLDTFSVSPGRISIN